MDINPSHGLGARRCSGESSSSNILDVGIIRGYQEIKISGFRRIFEVSLSIGKSLI